jgi:hypothetical protein
MGVPELPLTVTVVPEDRYGVAGTIEQPCDATDYSGEILDVQMCMLHQEWIARFVFRVPKCRRRGINTIPFADARSNRIKVAPRALRPDMPENTATERPETLDVVPMPILRPVVTKQIPAPDDDLLESQLKVVPIEEDNRVGQQISLMAFGHCALDKRIGCALVT